MFLDASRFFRLLQQIPETSSTKTSLCPGNLVFNISVILISPCVCAGASVDSHLTQALGMIWGKTWRNVELVSEGCFEYVVLRLLFCYWANSPKHGNLWKLAESDAYIAMKTQSFSEVQYCSCPCENTPSGMVILVQLWSIVCRPGDHFTSPKYFSRMK